MACFKNANVTCFQFGQQISSGGDDLAGRRVDRHDIPRPSPEPRGQSPRRLGVVKNRRPQSGPVDRFWRCARRTPCVTGYRVTGLGVDAVGLLVDLVRFELTTSSMPFKKYQSVTDTSTKNKRLSMRRFGRRWTPHGAFPRVWTPRGLQDSTPGTGTVLPRARLRAALIVFGWVRCR